MVTMLDLGSNLSMMSRKCGARTAHLPATGRKTRLVILPYSIRLRSHPTTIVCRLVCRIWQRNSIRRQIGRHSKGQTARIRRHIRHRSLMPASSPSHSVPKKTVNYVDADCSCRKGQTEASPFLLPQIKYYEFSIIKNPPIAKAMGGFAHEQVVAGIFLVKSIDILISQG